MPHQSPMSLAPLQQNPLLKSLLSSLPPLEFPEVEEQHQLDQHNQPLHHPLAHKNVYLHQLDEVLSIQLKDYLEWFRIPVYLGQDLLLILNHHRLLLPKFQMYKVDDKLETSRTCRLRGVVFQEYRDLLRHKERGV